MNYRRDDTPPKPAKWRACRKTDTGSRDMNFDLTADELAFLKTLSTVEPVKPTVPAPVASRLIELGLAITLVEGGLQLTALGRERLTQADR
jgi:hypothetical protein